jgi:hypothetical protein
MAWTKLDDNFADHPKIAQLSDAAFRAFVAGLCYASRYLTDGVIHEHAAKRTPARVRNELVSAGLWHENDDGNVEIHDYLEWNRDAETVKAERKANAARQRKHRDRNAVTDAVTNAVSNGTQSSPVLSSKKNPCDAAHRESEKRQAKLEEADRLARLEENELLARLEEEGRYDELARADRLVDVAREERAGRIQYEKRARAGRLGGLAKADRGAT